MKGPAANQPPNVRPQCTTSDRSLMIDAAFGATGVFVALMGGLLYQAEPTNTGVLDVMIIGGLGMTVAMLVSSGIGYCKVKRCRMAVDEFDRRMAPPGDPPASYSPPAYPPGSYPPPATAP